MRRISVMTAALILVMSAPSFAQDWIQYRAVQISSASISRASPRCRTSPIPRNIDITLPGRVYSAASGPSRYSVTVVNYADAEKIHTARAEQCRKKGGEGDACQNDWRGEVQGAIVYASWKFFQRNAKVTHYAWYSLGPGRRTSAATPQPRRIPDVRRDPQAWHPSVHPGGTACPRVCRHRDCFSSRCSFLMKRGSPFAISRTTPLDTRKDGDSRRRRPRAADDRPRRRVEHR